MELLVSREILYNIFLLLAACGLYELFAGLLPRRRTVALLVTGAVSAGVGILLMSSTVVLAPGIALDARTLLIAATAEVFGPIPATIVVVALALYRTLAIGGIASPAAVAAMALIGGLGLLWRRLDLRARLRSRWLSAYLYGLAAHAIMVLCSFLIPGEAGLWTLRTIALPVLTVYPVATMLLVRLLEEQEARLAQRVRNAEDLDRYRILFESRHAVMLLIEPGTGRILDANPAAAAFYGWTVDELRGMEICRINILPPHEILPGLERVASGGKQRLRHRLKDGSMRDVEVSGGIVQVRGKALYHAIIQDVTEQVEAERTYRLSEVRDRTILENAPYGIFIQTGGVIRYVNATACRLFGADTPDRLLGTPIFDHFAPEFHDRIRQRIARILDERREVPDVEFQFLRLDGTRFDVGVRAVGFHYAGPADGSPDAPALEQDGILVFFQDLSERKRLEREKRDVEARLMQQHKLESLGTLASGVAHEINNPLFGIRNYAELVLEDLPGDSADSGYLRTILKETDRISGIVANLLQFSRVDRHSHSPARVRDIVERSAQLIAATLRKDHIEVVLDVPDDLPELRCRSQQIQQVVLNLLTNARDALNARYPDQDPDKRIEVAARLETADDGRWIRLSVRDRGEGIPPEVRDLIFDPFFTTKPRDQGTGLGLSISFGIVRDHHGTIEVDSVPGQYTDMQVLLPVDADWGDEEDAP